MAYDLLVVTREEPYYGWPSVKRYLKYKMPPRHRDVPYANVYIYSLDFVLSHPSPFFRLAHAEGELLYVRDTFRFRRPRKSYDFIRAAGEASRSLDTFFGLGSRFLDQADLALTENDIRQAAFGAAQAAALFYHALFVVFHGFDPETHDPVLMHERLRTLSAELMLLFDPGHVDYNDTLPCLKRFLIKARYDPGFTINPHELEEHIDRVKRMQGVVDRACRQRITTYIERYSE